MVKNPYTVVSILAGNSDEADKWSENGEFLAISHVAGNQDHAKRTLFRTL